MLIDFKNPTPLYRQIADKIKEDIQTGKLSIGDQIDSQHELVKKFGVSLITVKRALAELINEGVLYSRVGKGTYVSQTPGKKSAISNQTIGLVLKDLRSPFFSMIVHSVEEFASQRGYHVLLSNSAKNIEKEESQIRNYYDMGVSGMIIASMTHEYTANEALRLIHKANYPYIMISYIDDQEIFYVGTDHEDGSHQATSHLLSLGYKKFGYIDGEVGNIVGALRLRGFQKALKEKNVPFDEAFHFRLRLRGEVHDYSSGYEIGERFVESEEKPEAIFAYNDLSALGFMQAVLDHDLKIPGDVAIVGFDDIERSKIAPVPLTTVRQSARIIGAIAVDNLIKRINGESVSVKTVLKPQLIVRESSDAMMKQQS